MSSVLLESKWKSYQEALLEGLEGNKRLVMKTVLDNTARALTENSSGLLAEAATAGSTAAGNIATLNKVILPVIRRVMPTVIANEIIGVQPMTGPVGQIHTLRVRYADTVPAAGGGVASGDEALSPFFLARYYSGNEDTANPQAAPTASLEGTGGNRISIQVLKEVVEARSRKLSASWTFEAAQDAQAMQGLDIEAEIMAVLAQEITAEIDQEILGALRALPGGATVTFDQALVSGTPTFVGDEHAALAILINQQSNLIARRTRRGAGNWCVVSPNILTVLQSATTSAFARTTEGTFEAPTNTKFVGTLNSTMKVFVDAYANDNTDILVGYKGPGEIDAAAFYCPYVPLMSSGVIMDPNTFQPVVSFSTRYGYVELSNQASSLGNAADYLGLIGVNAATLTFQ